MDVPQTTKSYAACLINLMSFINGVPHDSTASFSHEQLSTITANQVAVYLNMKKEGTTTPGPNNCPTQE